MISHFIMFSVEHFVLIALFSIVAFIYSSVGFGGGTSYLAILTFWSVSMGDMRAIALLCNLVVVSSSVLLFYKKGFYQRSKILSLVILSIPLAFLGGRIKLEDSIFYILLGVTLVIAAIMMWIPKKEVDSVEKKSHIKNAAIGGFIGGLSGLLGIGGGVFLSPFLHLTNYDKAKRIAAFSSLFILVNSVAGIVGQWTKSGAESLSFTLMLSLMTAVFLGGQVGVRLGVKRFSASVIKRITALLIGLVGSRLLWVSFVG